MSNSTNSSMRIDIYRHIHKALRAYMCDTLTRVGRLDGRDLQETSEVLAQVRAMAAFCAGHIKHENNFVHPAMEARLPGSSKVTASDHEHHVDACEKLHAFADAVEQAGGPARDAAILQLYRYLALFVGENLTHMNIEEMENNAVLWATYADIELIGIEQAIVASLSPEEKMLSARWMIPAINPEERAELLKGMLQAMPRQVFDGMLAQVKPYLSNADWSKLMLALWPAEALAA